MIKRQKKPKLKAKALHSRPYLIVQIIGKVPTDQVVDEFTDKPDASEVRTNLKKCNRSQKIAKVLNVCKVWKNVQNNARVSKCVQRYSTYDICFAIF